MFKEFKEFAFKGNLIDMAVGIMIGGAFATVVKSLVDNVFMPPLGILLSNVDFKKLQYTFKEGVPGKDGIEAIPAVTLNYGQFFTDLISFILMALAIFIIVKKVISFIHKKAEEPASTPAPHIPTKEELLLTEIRDLLAEKS
jgi:large conductance mechanosensitive channel